jgi:hypothetical protein
MQSDLFANPFAILGLAGDATVAAITARARELGTAAAAAASRTLLIPRNRLQAELGFLPGAPQDLADASLTALKENREPDQWPRLTLSARANLLAHLASARAANADQLRDLVEMQEAIRSSWAETVDQVREHARMPPIPPEAADSILETTVNQHAEAFAAGMLALSNGDALFAQLLCDTKPNALARSDFLRQSAASWDRVLASEVEKDLETAAPIEGALRADPDPEAAERLARIVLRYAYRTKPPREANRLVGLPHKPSVEAAERWRELALDLNNRQDAVVEAVIVLKALTEGFGTTDELGSRTANDLEVCRRRIATGEAEPESLRLIAAIKTATENEMTLQRVAMVNGEPTAQTPPIAVELHHAFVAAARSARNDLPWYLLRNFTLRLHNEFSATEAALAFTQLAIAKGRDSSVAAGVLPQLRIDERALRKQTLCVELTAVLRSDNMGVARRLLTEIIGLTDDAKERREFQANLKMLNQRQARRTLKYAFWGVVAVVVLISMFTSKNAPQAPLAISSPPPSAPFAVDPDAGRPARQPSPGTSVLSRSELRWCRYQQARARAASDYLKGLNAEANVSGYNAAVDAFNAFISPLKASCTEHRQYYTSDGSVVDAEVIQNDAGLRADGRRIITAAYQTAPVYAPPPTLPLPTPIVPAPSKPATGSGPPPTVKDLLAYNQGQADMRNWLAWFVPLDGAYRNGAEWWASQRSLRSPPSCDKVPGADHAAAYAGCLEARRRLAGSERRRRVEPDYKAGRNNP